MCPLALLREAFAIALPLLPLTAAWMLRRQLGMSLGSARLSAAASEHARNYASIIWHFDAFAAEAAGGGERDVSRIRGQDSAAVARLLSTRR